MNTSRHFPRPLVPSHYIKQTIKRLPYDVPRYISVDNDDEWGGGLDNFAVSTFFVDATGGLRVMGDTEIYEGEADIARSPLGRIGIMRAALIEEGSALRDVYVADMRFLGSHQLCYFDDMVGPTADQSDHMVAAQVLEESIVCEGIIAAEQDTHCSRRNIPKGTFYGNERLYPILTALRKFGSQAMREYFDLKRTYPTRTTEGVKTQRTKVDKHS
ncbi:MAG: hypothetical protein WAS27_02290 [Candidatus Saccharimonadales bacterium]